MTGTAADRELRFVDAHVHFYDMGRPRLQYDHSQPDRGKMEAAALGDALAPGQHAVNA